ncbi:MAG TPA: hypothetical protein VM493_00210 [Vicinamibacterales bacterium]|nr:hypothetical protein [Vicinamibacterales bacterium]
MIATIVPSFLHRSMFNLILKAVSLTTSIKVLSKSFAEEREARAWLTEQRRAWLASGRLPF